MKLIYVCCIKCQNELAFVDDSLVCRRCGAVYPVVNGIPQFISVKAVPKNKATCFWARLFESPKLYNWLVKLKTIIAPDLKMGIRDLTDGHSLLNAGCGASVTARHLEYDINAVSNFAGVDVSPDFVEAARAGCGRRDADFCVASIEKLPYKDSNFDVVLISFVLHHLPFQLDLAIREAMRVARCQVIIYDHVKSSKRGVWRLIQETYWRLFDGGCQYLTLEEWEALLGKYRVQRSIKTGAIGKHVIKFVLEKNVCS
jgi:SAM-dependent methyltransferase